MYDLWVYTLEKTSSNVVCKCGKHPVVYLFERNIKTELEFLDTL